MRCLTTVVINCPPYVPIRFFAHTGWRGPFPRCQHKEWTVTQWLGVLLSLDVKKSSLISQIVFVRVVSAAWRPGQSRLRHYATLCLVSQFHPLVRRRAE